ncbi:MAG: hypothetical protein OXL37_09490 [Chloroflexota bacterium]|nr:hypothetical protein [Chloroflexota bacterium]MDE2960093.1 hypothetical protein [Chloroflexota bacterium]
MKDTITITVTVDSGVAEYFRTASDVDRHKIELLVNLHLRDMMALDKKRREDEEARGEYWEADQRRLKAEMIAKLGLDKVPETGRSLEETMAEMSRKAQERGLTWEILQSILDE